MSDKHSKGFWNKIKAGVAVIMASLTIAIPTVIHARNKQTKSLEEGTTVSDSTRGVNEGNDGITENPDSTLEVDADAFRESLKVTIPDNENTKIYTGFSYDQLVNELNTVMDERKFDEMSCKYLRLMFDDIYNNYDEWKGIYPSMPDKSVYMGEVIDIIRNNIRSISFQKLHEDPDRPAGGLDDGFNVRMLYAENEEEAYFNDDIPERLAHEVIGHGGQKGSIFNDEYFEGYEYMQPIIIEGRSNSC